MVRMIRSGQYSLADDPQTGEPRWDRSTPDIYGHVLRDGLRCRWMVTAEQDGPGLAEGRTWTRGGAWVKAIAAAHRPGIADGGAR